MDMTTMKVKIHGEDGDIEVPLDVYFDFEPPDLETGYDGGYAIFSLQRYNKVIDAAVDHFDIEEELRRRDEQSYESSYS